jgi:hypothetical protein
MPAPLKFNLKIEKASHPATLSLFARPDNGRFAAWRASGLSGAVSVRIRAARHPTLASGLAKSRGKLMVGSMQ